MMAESADKFSHCQERLTLRGERQSMVTNVAMANRLNGDIAGSSRPASRKDR